MELKDILVREIKYSVEENIGSLVQQTWLYLALQQRSLFNKVYFKQQQQSIIMITTTTTTKTTKNV
jgi:hypothetical protein